MSILESFKLGLDIQPQQEAIVTQQERVVAEQKKLEAYLDMIPNAEVSGQSLTVAHAVLVLAEQVAIWNDMMAEKEKAAEQLVKEMRDTKTTTFTGNDPSFQPPF